MMGKVIDGRRKRRPARRARAANKRFENELIASEDRADAIMESYRTAPSRGVRPYANAASFLKREAYALIRHTIDLPYGYRVLGKIVKDEDIIPRVPDLKENPFYWGLLAMDPDAAHTEREAQGDAAALALLRGANFLDRKTRSRYAWQLLYAHKNGVPPEYLVGFLYQVGGPVGAAKLCKSFQQDASLSGYHWERGES